MLHRHGYYSRDVITSKIVNLFNNLNSNLSLSPSNIYSFKKRINENINVDIKNSLLWQLKLYSNSCQKREFYSAKAQTILHYLQDD